MELAARTAAWSGDKLPYDAEVEWLKFNGYEYIDTKISSRYDTLVDITYKIGNPPPYAEWLIGSANFTWGGLGFGYSALSNNSVGKNIPYWGTSSNGNETSRSIVTFNEWTNFRMISNSQWYFNDELKSVSDSVGVGIYNTLSNIQIGLLAQYFGPYYQFRGDVKYCKITQDGNLVRDLIPVRVGNVGYMYDRVSGQLFGNSGTGAFIIGPDKT